MTFEMSITKKRPTTAGVEEHTTHIKNSEAILSGDNLADILRIALESSAEITKPTEADQRIWKEPTISLLNNKVETPKVPEVKKPDSVAAAPKAPNTKTYNSVPTGPAVAPRPKRVDLIGSETKGFSIGEMLNQETEEKKETAVLPSASFTDEEELDLDPNRRVKLWVNCTECDFKGHKGTNLGKETYRCPKCGTNLHIIDATEEHGAKDDKGYVLLAQERHYTLQERYEYKQAKLAEES